MLFFIELFLRKTKELEKNNDLPLSYSDSTCKCERLCRILRFRTNDSSTQKLIIDDLYLLVS